MDQKALKKAKIKIHSKDMEKLNIENNEIIEIGNNGAKLKIHTEAFDGILPGVVIVEEYGLMNALLKD